MTPHTTIKPNKIGFIGQGFIGRHMADDFAERGYEVVRYALEEAYVGNREAIKECDVVFIAIPTPTKNGRCDVSGIESVLPLIGAGKVAVIKSTIVPGTTSRLQAQFAHITVIHSPEFLREKYAGEDTRKPERTIIGIPKGVVEGEAVAAMLLSVLPSSPYARVCTAEEAEITKYGGNTFLAMKVVYMNLLYDLAQAVGADYDVVADMIGHDSRIGMSHTKVLDASGHTPGLVGRGAGGHCFPKDLAALRACYGEVVGSDEAGLAFLTALEEKNCELLRATKKDLDLLEAIYGPR